MILTIRLIGAGHQATDSTSNLLGFRGAGQRLARAWSAAWRNHAGGKKTPLIGDEEALGGAQEEGEIAPSFRQFREMQIV